MIKKKASFKNKWLFGAFGESCYPLQELNLGGFNPSIAGWPRQALLMFKFTCYKWTLVGIRLGHCSFYVIIQLLSPGHGLNRTRNIKTGWAHVLMQGVLCIILQSLNLSRYCNNRDKALLNGDWCIYINPIGNHKILQGRQKVQHVSNFVTVPKGRDISQTTSFQIF